MPASDGLWCRFEEGQTLYWIDEICHLQDQAAKHAGARTYSVSDA